MKPSSSVVFFPCHDINETTRYYTEVIGLPIAKDLGNCMWFDTGYGYISFTEYGDNRPMATSFCLSFNMESNEEVDNVYERLVATGRAIGIKDPPQDHAIFPVYSFFLSDPNGYMLEFQKVKE